MADIELVIKMPEEVYKAYKMDSTLCMLNTDQKSIANNCLINAILNGIPLPKDHGDLKDIREKIERLGEISKEIKEIEDKIPLYQGDYIDLSMLKAEVFEIIATL